MASKRKFYRTVYTVEVLSEEPMDSEMGLSDIDYAITDGDCSGRFAETSHEVVAAPAMAKMLQEQGSDPEFFRLDENGDDAEGCDDYILPEA